MAERISQKMINCFELFCELNELHPNIDACCWITQPFGEIVRYMRQISHFKDKEIYRYRRREHIFFNFNGFTEINKNLTKKTCNELKNLINREPKFSISVYWYKNDTFLAWYQIAPKSLRSFIRNYPDINRKDLNLLTRMFIYKKFKSKRCSYLRKGRCSRSIGNYPCLLMLWLKKNREILLKDLKKFTFDKFKKRI